MLKLMLLCVTNGIVIDDIIFLPSVYTVKYWCDKLSIVLFNLKTKSIQYCFVLDIAFLEWESVCFWMGLLKMCQQQSLHFN